MTAPFGLHSEVGGLDTVIVHPPGRELGTLTPDDKGEMPGRGGPLWLTCAGNRQPV